MWNVTLFPLCVLQNLRGLDITDGALPTTQKQRAVGFQRRHSLCPVTLPNSKFNSGSFDASAEPSFWPLNTVNQQWNQQQQLPRSTLNHIPFRVDRSASMIEGHVGSLGTTELPPQLTTSTCLMPPPGLSVSTSSLSSPKSPTPSISPRYKTELCRTYEENGTCKYGAKCQFAHGMDEMRGLNRHPKYKTEPCRTFHTIGFCPYGARCHFVHNADEVCLGGTAPNTRQKMRERPQLMRQSVSFAGFSSQPLTGFQAVQEPMTFSRASSVSPPPSTGSPDLLSPLYPEPRALKQSYPLSADLDSDHLIANHHRLFRLADSKVSSGYAPMAVAQNCHRNAFTFTGLSVLQRSTSADSLSDKEGYTSSSSLSGSDSPSLDGRRLPIFSRLSV